MRRTHIPTALLLCLSKEQRFTEKERQRTFWSALYLSLFELLSQTSCFRCLKNTKSCNTFQSSELTTDVTLYLTRTENVHVK